MTDLYIPDTSEWHPMEDYAGPIILRAHNGYRPDRVWAGDSLKAVAQSWWGAYQYLPGSADPAAAARAFVDTLGSLQPNVVILDLEEGDGDQSGRQHAWLDTVTGHPEWTYSGDYFARTHGVAVNWIAAYQNNEPTTAHALWQFADNHAFPGISQPCDASVFHGTLNDLIALTSGGIKEDDMAADLVELDTGEIIAIPKSGAKPWHVPNPFVEALGQLGGSLANPNPVPVLTKDQSDSYRVFV